ncbi:phosphotransferase family protein [Marinovum sp.]|uniref:phosphotransferase family protein n=1 Tax=Marinovum sp. TaxID=2024839 RepID=UPI003A8CFED8
MAMTSRPLTASSPLCIPGLDVARLQAYLKPVGISLVPGASPRKFAAGFGNMNFLLETDLGPLVLRRPPLGPVPPGANDMAREYRILSHLHPVLPLVPEARLFCEDLSVIGAPFLLMEYRPGLVIGSELPSDTIVSWKGTGPIGLALGRRIIDVLTRLHAIDAKACGLGTLGRPDGFVERTQRGWSKRARLAWDNAPEDLTSLLGWLDAHPPKTSRAPTLIHNDFKLDNIILDPDTLEPRTLIDWDMGTLGDPLYDLAVLLSYWTEAEDPEAMHQLRQMPTARHGFPTRQEAATLYAKASGRRLTDFTYYRVLATLRLAVVFQQLYRRYESGGTDDPDFARFDDLSRGLLSFGLQVARGDFY